MERRREDSHGREDVSIIASATSPVPSTFLVAVTRGDETNRETNERV